MTNLTRREFLKLGGGTLAGLFLPLPPQGHDAREKGRLGRVTDWAAWVHAAPDLDAPIVREHRLDDVVTYFEEVRAKGHNPNNLVWFRVIDGYIYSSFVQPVEVCLNTPLQEIPSEGMLGEISVPYTDARLMPSPDASRSYRLRYSSAYRVAEAEWGEDRRLWYRLYESQVPSARRYVPAEHVRLISPEDLTPISPQVRDKWIEISLANQLLVAYEGDEPVFRTRVSTGVGGSTPRGHHYIVFKSPSRHMVGPGFDLPGVSFDSYFWNSIAIHGAYWHNDFGRPRSHGCVNVPHEAAKWIFRWTTPVCPYEEDNVRVQTGGTPVIVE